ncbi:unnamed protein product [Auanema sp. JU1783]|nr:unnamed protein product [Auanema sp. JU1783]
MEPTNIFRAVLLGNWIVFLWDLYLSWRQYKVHERNARRPNEVADLITEEDYNKARSYKLDKHRFSFAQGIYGQLLTTVVLCYQFLPKLWYLCDGLPLQSVAFTVLSSLVSTVVDLPWSLYDTFVIEEKHGFNKQTLGFYLKDTVKKLVVSSLLTTPIVYGLEWIVLYGGEYFFVYTWLFVSVIIFVLMTIYPAFIAPLFDKYIPLPDGPLKTAIEQLAASVSYPLTKLYVVHGSKRSAHSNAYMYGFWKNKRIVLYDTLLSGEEKEKVIKECAEAGEEKQDEKEKARGMSNDEVVAVLGHELGHWALSHTVINLIITELNIFIMFYAFSYLYKWNNLYECFGFTDTPVIIGFILVFQFVMAPYHQIDGFLMNMHSRRCEFQADEYANQLGFGPQLITALKKLSKDNLSMPIDDIWYSTFNHSHPPIIERVRAINEYKAKAQ